jgi:hypothetical protein
MEGATSPTTGTPIRTDAVECHQVLLRLLGVHLRSGHDVLRGMKRPDESRVGPDSAEPVASKKRLLPLGGGTVGATRALDRATFDSTARDDIANVLG